MMFKNKIILRALLQIWWFALSLCLANNNNINNNNIDNKSIPSIIPHDWVKRYELGHLTFSNTLPKLPPYIGNGYIATHPLHSNPMQSQTIYISGVFNGVAVYGNCTVPKTNCIKPHRATIPKHRIEFKPTKSNNEKLIGFALDMEKGIFTQRREIKVDNENNLNCQIDAIYYAHATLPNALIHQVTFTNMDKEHDIDISNIIENQFEFNIGKDGGDFNWDINGTSNISNNIYNMHGTVKNMELPDEKFTSIATATLMKPVLEQQSSSDEIIVKPNQTYTIFFPSIFCTSLDIDDHDDNEGNKQQQLFEDALQCANGKLEEIMAMDIHTIYSSHTNAWIDTMDNGRIEIIGDLDLAQSINASVYYILSSIRSDWPQGLSPGGLASDGYEGHSFWDMETWMYPPLLMLQPKIAKSCLQYRILRKEKAKDKAARYGFEGYMFPWESAHSGEETCGTSYGQVSVWGAEEHHITGDISFAAQQYFQLTGDIAFLKSDLYDLFSNIADYWCSHATFNETNNKYHILNVMGPDEYHHPVNDSTYTNVIAQMSLLNAIKASKILNVPSKKKWIDVQENMYIPFDKIRQIHPEYDGYEGTTNVKQADTILLNFPLQFQYRNNQILENDLLYYMNRTDPTGPAMTWAMFAIGSLDAGSKYEQQALAFFKRGYANQQAPFKVWTETPTGGTVNFITGAGGFLQSVINGYCGLRLNDDSLYVKPYNIPVKNMILHNIHYQGFKLVFNVSNEEYFTVRVSGYDEDHLVDTRIYNSTSRHDDGLIITDETSGKVYDLNIGEKAIQLNCCGGEHVDNSYTITRNVGL